MSNKDMNEYDEYTEGCGDGFDNCKKLVIQLIKDYKAKNMTFYAIHAATLIEVFEMTHSSEGGNYRGYTPIKGFEGRNVEELKQNIDDYLRDLIELINKPLCDCPNCKGAGVLLDK